MILIHARWYTAATSRTIDWVVLHAMQAPEKGDTAEAVARYFSRLPATRKASAHYCLDDDSTVRCLPDMYVAYGAPGANHNGIHLEHAGYSEQTGRQWGDPYSERMLRRSAKLSAQLCRTYSLPAIFVGVRGLQAGKKGITTHAAVSKAFRRSNHWDPGPNFPIDHYVTLTRTELERLNDRAQRC